MTAAVEQALVFVPYPASCLVALQGLSCEGEPGC